MTCTIAALAEQLKLDEGTLLEYGLADDARRFGGCVRIPYHDEHGLEVGVRLQTALNGYDRFRRTIQPRCQNTGSPALFRETISGSNVRLEDKILI